MFNSLYLILDLLNSHLTLCVFKPVVNIKYSFSYGDFLIWIVLIRRMTKDIRPSVSGLFMPCRNKTCVLDILTEASVAIVLTERMTLIGRERIKQAKLTGQETPNIRLCVFLLCDSKQAPPCTFFVCLFVFLSHKTLTQIHFSARQALYWLRSLSSPVSTLGLLQRTQYFLASSTLGYSLCLIL